jgi:preprotein translocase subunit SecD
MRKVFWIFFMLLVINAIGFSQTESVLKQDSSKQNRKVGRQQAGFYLIIAEAEKASSLPAATDKQQIVRYDYKFLRDSERGEPRYLLLSKSADVPLILARAPELQSKGENGFPELRLELTPESANMLEQLTRNHLGGKVAFVIDGEPVTLHKIRSVITGGQFRISRCTDTACQYIYGRLVKKQ